MTLKIRKNVITDKTKLQLQEQFLLLIKIFPTSEQNVNYEQNSEADTVDSARTLCDFPLAISIRPFSHCDK